jgi:hypothetical protein
MSTHPSLVTLAAVVTTAFVLVAEIFLGTHMALAEGAQWETEWETEWETRVHPSHSPSLAILPIAPPRALGVRDEIAALERIQFALSEVGDGDTYVWRRWHGRLAGVFHPTVSFKDPSGHVCRHLMVVLTNGKRTSKIGGIACRLPSGRWRL